MDAVLPVVFFTKSCNEDLFPFSLTFLPTDKTNRRQTDGQTPPDAPASASLFSSYPEHPSLPFFLSKLIIVFGQGI
jgi:hypothetical protein